MIRWILLFFALCNVCIGFEVTYHPIIKNSDHIIITITPEVPSLINMVIDDYDSHDNGNNFTLEFKSDVAVLFPIKIICLSSSYIDDNNINLNTEVHNFIETQSEYKIFCKPFKFNSNQKTNIDLILPLSNNIINSNITFVSSIGEITKTSIIPILPTLSNNLLVKVKQCNTKQLQIFNDFQRKNSNLLSAPVYFSFTYYVESLLESPHIESLELYISSIARFYSPQHDTSDLICVVNGVQTPTLLFPNRLVLSLLEPVQWTSLDISCKDSIFLIPNISRPWSNILTAFTVILNPMETSGEPQSFGVNTFVASVESSTSPTDFDTLWMGGTIAVGIVCLASGLVYFFWVRNRRAARISKYDTIHSEKYEQLL